ncbi:MAG: AI-2E family transporter, partial [Muribaculaceae bacterium]|nr:AI-2E family transporter [Muribaculaceae bacterium]
VNCGLFMVPYLVYVSVVPVTVMCIFHAIDTGVDFWTIWLECVAVYAAVEAFSDLFLTPRIMGKAMGLNPAVILLALSVWGTLLGVLGMVIALPATTIMIKWLKMWLVSIDRARQPGAVTSQSGAETGSSS